jgi:hypothetical protein
LAPFLRGSLRHGIRVRYHITTGGLG